MPPGSASPSRRAAILTPSPKISFIDADVANVNADAKFDPLILWHTAVLLCHGVLNFSGTSRSVDDARELGQQAVARALTIRPR
ncbi:hypothetical protein IVA80_07590 [Bradyrhizobium sp. 139]|uniref:hypothetical protein n=1 Tax=Bradyrhizobium sp. 139 TaxID=2782616 RepID=UPI0031FF2FC0|nr:hypothetical protein [Bradyrhizobium sp. 139]